MKNRFFLILSFLLLASVFPLAAQNGFTVSGIVMTEQGEELPGVTIQYKNNPSKGAITDVDGNFRMDNVPANTVLVFTYIGYAPQELVVNGNKTKQKIALKEIVNETDEVVIVGRGTQRKISVVGAVTNVKASDLQVPSSSVTNMLGGRVPGIIAVTRSGEPGNDFSEFWIRGISTFGAGASALVLIDGVEGDLNILDPADIESFTILKDASSTAVYGVRGANGVVLVTTKRGKSGKLNISVKSNVGLSYSARNPEYVDGYTYAQLANEASVVRGGRPVYSNAELNLIETGLDPDLYPNVNWRDVMLKDYVWNNQHHISINGGGTNARYYMSVGLQHKDAIYKQDKGIKNYDNSVGYNKYNFRANIDANLTKSTIIELGLSTEIVTNSFPGYANDTKALWQTQANLTPVTVPVLYSDGSLPAYGASADQQNPYILLNYTGYKKKNETTSSIRLRLEQDFDQWIKGLKAEATMSINNYSALTQSQTKTPALYYAQGRNKDGSLNLIEKVAKTDDKYESTNLSTRKIYFDARVNYNRLFNNDHRVTGLADFYMEDFITGEAQTLIASIPKRYTGLAGRATYSYKDTYFLEGNIGYTGSEAFEKGQKFGVFPAISAGWVPTQYEWVQKNLSFINFFKIRASYGIVGNDRLGNDTRFPFLSTMTEGSGAGIWGSGKNIAESQEASQNLRWEKAKKFDIGIDGQLFNSSVEFTVDFFSERRTGIFQQRASIPDEMGLATLPWANVGEMKSWGADGNISYTYRFKNDMSLTGRANFTYSNNKLLEYEQSGIKYPYQAWKGTPWGTQRGLVALGLFKDQADIDSSPKQTFVTSVMPGDIKYKDINGDGKIDSYDEVPICYSNVPRLQYGFGLEFHWKRLTVSALLEGVGQVNFLYGGSGFHPFNGGQTGNVLSIVADASNRWTPASYSGTKDTENPNARFPRLTYGENKNNNQASTFWIADGSYVRLKNVQIMYDITLPCFKKIGLQGCQISLIGDNLHCWDKIKLWDPAQASDNGTVYPLQRVFTIQANLQF